MSGYDHPMPTRFVPRPPQVSPAPIDAGVLSLATDRAGSLVALERDSANRGAAWFLYDVESGALLLDEVRFLSLLPTGRRAVAGNPGEPAYVIDFDTKARVKLEGGTWARAVGDRFGWSWGDDAKIVVWDLVTGAKHGELPEPPRRFPTPGAHAPRFAASTALPDGKTLVWLDARFGLWLLDLEGCEAGEVIPGGPRELPEKLMVGPNGAGGLRAFAVGAKSAVVVFDVGGRAVAKRHDKGLGMGGRADRIAILDDGRVVVEDRFLEVVDPMSGKRQALGARDPNREHIHAIASLGGRLVAVLIDRAENPAEPWDTTRFLELWDVAKGRMVTKVEAEGVTAPLVTTQSQTRLFARQDVDVEDSMAVWSTWRAWDLEETEAKASPIGAKREKAVVTGKQGKGATEKKTKKKATTKTTKKTTKKATRR
jgi:hypothetical protein